jgi:hypothetical protein
MVQEHRSLTFMAILGTALLLGGCPAPWPRPTPPNGASPTPAVPPPGEPGASANPPGAPPAPRPPLTPREHRFSPATRALVTQAQTLLARGDIDGASSTLDRALRIEPSNPLLWVELGRVRLVESDAHQAEACARKALALATGDRSTQAQAGRLLADALKAQGRNPEAQAVEDRPYMH